MRQIRLVCSDCKYLNYRIYKEEIGWGVCKKCGGKLIKHVTQRIVKSDNLAKQQLAGIIHEEIDFNCTHLSRMLTKNLPVVVSVNYYSRSQEA